MAATIVGCARRILRLHKETKELDRKLNQRKQELASAKEALLDIFQRNGLQSTSTKTYTLSISRQIFATLRNKEVGIRILKKHGLDWLVQDTVNNQTLSAWVREQCPDETSLPELPNGLKQQIKVFEKFGISVRKR